MNIAANNTLVFFYGNRPAIIFREQVTSQGASEGPSEGLSQALSQGLSQAYGLPTPLFQQDEDFRVVLYRPETEENEVDNVAGTQSGTQSGTQLGTQSGTQSETAIKILEFCLIPRKVGEIREYLGYTNRTKFRNSYMKPLLDDEYLEMTIPDKPQSSSQRYRLTEKGAELLNKVTEVQNDK